MDETEAKEQALELGLNASEVISGDELTAKLRENGGVVEISGRGNGPIDAFMDAMKKHSGIELKVVDYRERRLRGGISGDEDGSVSGQARSNQSGRVRMVVVVSCPPQRAR